MDKSKKEYFMIALITWVCLSLCSLVMNSILKWLGVYSSNSMIILVSVIIMIITGIPLLILWCFRNKESKGMYYVMYIWNLLTSYIVIGLVSVIIVGLISTVLAIIITITIAKELSMAQRLEGFVNVIVYIAPVVFIIIQTYSPFNDTFMDKTFAFKKYIYNRVAEENIDVDEEKKWVYNSMIVVIYFVAIILTVSKMYCDIYGLESIILKNSVAGLGIIIAVDRLSKHINTMKKEKKIR